VVQDGMSGWASGGAGLIKPPLVTMVLINWNYAHYVDAAINSIRDQDYPSLEAIVVDNGSTDASRDVIAKHVGEDPRFRIVHLEDNLGQLGAYFDIFKLIRGEFVTIVDADDVLFPNFVSCHVQVHLALPSSVALTSSNVVEMSAEGRALTGGYGSFGRGVTPASRGLRPLDAGLKLPTISAADYLEISRSCSTFAAGGIGWIWGPGTANMYRRSFLALVQQEPRSRVYLRAADSYLNRFCHVLGGSALINMRLSGYRIHGANYFSLRERVGDLETGRIEFRLRAHREHRETMSFLFHRAAFFQFLLKHRFWLALQQLMAGVPDRSGYYAHPDTRKLLVENYAGLAQVFGESGLLAGLRSILPFKEFRALIREAHSKSIPPRLRIALLLERGKSVWAAAQKSVRKGRSLVARRVPLRIAALNVRQAFARKRPALKTDRDQVELGPAAVVCSDPPIFLTGMAFQEMIGIAPAFGRTFGSRPAAFLVYPCWSIENRHRSAQVIQAAITHQTEYPAHELVFLCNTAAEREILAAGGLTAHLLNKSFIVSDTIFRPAANAQIEFDAVYNARFDPLKRHELAGAVPRVAYLSYFDASSGPDEAQLELAARILARNPGHALLNPVENGLPVRLPPEVVNAALNRASVGLCLSNVEGSNYASMEYMLAGLPIVSTPSVGGRHIYFDHEYCTICEPDPTSVRDAVEALKARNIPRDYIRARALAKIEPARRRFLSLIDDLSERLGGERHYDDGIWPFSATNDLIMCKTYAEHLRDFTDDLRGKN
jgi:glycosyltransferase involved in cell wall biosynthesis